MSYKTLRLTRKLAILCANKTLRAYLIALIVLMMLGGCNGSRESQIHVHDDNCIITEDLTCVSADYYTNLTDSQIAEIELNGGLENYLSQE